MNIDYPPDDETARLYIRNRGRRASDRLRWSRLRWFEIVLCFALGALFDRLAPYLWTLWALRETSP